MNTPRWYVKSGNSPGTIDLDAYEAEAQPFRRMLVESGQLLPVADPDIHWQAALDRIGATSEPPFTVSVDNREYFPAFFLDPTLNMNDLQEVLTVLRDLAGWSKFYFLTTKKLSLRKMTPLRALHRGKKETVLRAARAFSES